MLEDEDDDDFSPAYEDNRDQYELESRLYSEFHNNEVTHTLSQVKLAIETQKPKNFSDLDKEGQYRLFLLLNHTSTLRKNPLWDHDDACKNLVVPFCKMIKNSIPDEDKENFGSEINELLYEGRRFGSDPEQLNDLNWCDANSKALENIVIYWINSQSFNNPKLLLQYLAEGKEWFPQDYIIAEPKSFAPESDLISIAEDLTKLLACFPENDKVLAEKLSPRNAMESLVCDDESPKVCANLARAIIKRMTPDNLSIVDDFCHNSVAGAIIESEVFSSEEVSSIIDRLNKNQVSEVEESHDGICCCILNAALHRRAKDTALIDKIAAKTKTGLIGALAEYFEEGDVYDKYISILKERAQAGNDIAIKALKKLKVELEQPVEAKQASLGCLF